MTREPIKITNSSYGVTSCIIIDIYMVRVQCSGGPRFDPDPQNDNVFNLVRAGMESEHESEIRFVSSPPVLFLPLL